MTKTKRGSIIEPLFNIIYIRKQRFMIPNRFNNILYLADSNGTGFYRALQPVNQIWSLGPSTGINNSILFRPVGDAEYYKNLNSLMIQRWIHDPQIDMMKRFLYPVSHRFNFWTIYNIDDAMGDNDIPRYNRGRRAFVGKHIQDNIRYMLNSSDFILTTTDYIKEYYHKTYDVPLENIICIPNYLPYWWIGCLFDKDRNIDRFKKNKGGKIRVGVVSSLSHFNVDGVRLGKDNKSLYRDEENGKVTYHNEDGVEISENEFNDAELVKDDLDLILETIEKTVDRYQWVFFGYAPPKLQKYIEQKKIEIHQGVPIIDYPKELSKLNLDVIVAPIIDDEFNRCKSNIKYLESAAIGVPIFCSKVDPTYVKYMPEHQLFSDARDLFEKLDKFQNQSINRYTSIIEEQWKFLNSPHNECGIKSPDWWLEHNLKPWNDLFTMRGRSQEVELTAYVQVKKEIEEKKKQEQEKKVLFESQDKKVQILS